MTDDDVRAAIAASHLGDLPAELIGSLIAEARRVQIPAGATTHREGQIEPHLELVIRGLVRRMCRRPTAGR